MKNKIFNRIALVFSILTIVAFGAAIAPGILALILAVVAIAIGAFAIVVFLLGGFVGLLAWAGDGGAILSDVTALGIGSFNAAGAIFSILPPMTHFCFAYFSPICLYVGIGFGVVGLIFSIVALATAESKVSKVLITEEQSVAGNEGQEADKGKKKQKPKKKRTDRGEAILCLSLSIVFTVLNVLAVLAIHIIKVFNMFSY